MLSIIVAMDENGLIGRDNRLPWSLPADLQYFKKVTLGHRIVMGRKTFESIGRPLPGRQNIILTRNVEFEAQGCTVIHSLSDMPDTAQDEVFVIGGTEMFQMMLPLVDRMYITRIHAKLEGDVYFPTYDESEWRVVSRVEGVVDEENVYAHEFLVYERVS